MLILILLNVGTMGEPVDAHFWISVSYICIHTYAGAHACNVHLHGLHVLGNILMFGKMSFPE